MRHWYHKSEFLFYQFWANNKAQLFTHCSFTSCKITCYSLQSLLATPCRICLLQKSLAHRCKICSLLLAEVPRCRKSLVMQYSFLTRCRSCSLQKISSYSLGNSFVTRCNKSLVTRCRSYMLQKIICHLLKQSHVNKVKSEFLFFKYNLFSKATKFKVVQSQHMTLKSVISRTLSKATIYKCVKYTIYKSQLLHAPTKRNEWDLIKHPDYFTTCARWQTLNKNLSKPSYSNLRPIWIENSPWKQYICGQKPSS